MKISDTNCIALLVKTIMISVAITGLTGCFENVFITPTPPISEGQGYDKIALEPARTDWVPGLVFTGDVNGENIIVDEILCSNLFPDITPKKASIALNAIKDSSNFKFNISLTPLETLIGKNHLNIDLAKLEKEAKYQLDPGEAFYVYYSLDQQWKEGEPIEIDKNCQRAIEITQQKGEFENRVWIVPGATAFSGASYTFSNSLNLEASLKADFQKLLTAAASSGYENVEEGSMTKISDGKLLYVRSGIPRLVRSWVKSRAVGGVEEASIKTELPNSTINAITKSTKE